MKKKGFTLVELLAVIVILAIIALIAIPLIGNVIEKAKIGALESSVNGLVESANMYYANNTIKGETVTETTFDFENGEQVSTQKLEYKGKVYNGKLILHANGEVAVCIDDEEHYAYKNKDSDEIISGNGTCLYDGTTGNFSSNSSINDLRGKTVMATQIEESGDNALITIPEEGHYDGTSKISVPIETVENVVGNVYYLGSVKNSSTLDIKSKLPDVYANLTIDNFIVMPTSIGWAQGRSEQGSSSGKWNINYNASTGVLTVGASYSVPSNDGGGTHGIAYTAGNKVYCITGNIKSL